jgi:hypothetical protein
VASEVPRRTFQVEHRLISARCNNVCDYGWWDGGQSGTNYRFHNPEHLLSLLSLEKTGFTEEKSHAVSGSISRHRSLPKRSLRLLLNLERCWRLGLLKAVGRNRG